MSTKFERAIELESELTSLRAELASVKAERDAQTKRADFAPGDFVKLKADNTRLREASHAAKSWLRANANAEKDPVKRAVFIESHNAVAKILTAAIGEGV